MTGLPTRDRRAERREATRREIVDTAWDIARSEGLGSVTLREIAVRIGMRPPSLYSHFDSKNAVFDAMYTRAWRELEQAQGRISTRGPARQALLAGAEMFFDFAAGDPVRYQLMNQPALPDFRPGEDAYRAALDAYEHMRTAMAALGIRAQADLDLWTGVLTGFVNQQLANEPGGRRWRGQLARLIDIYCDAVGVPGPPLGSTR